MPLSAAGRTVLRAARRAKAYTISSSSSAMAVCVYGSMLLAALFCPNLCRVAVEGLKERKEKFRIGDRRCLAARYVYLVEDRRATSQSGRGKAAGCGAACVRLRLVLGANALVLSTRPQQPRAAAGYVNVDQGRVPVSGRGGRLRQRGGKATREGAGTQEDKDQDMEGRVLAWRWGAGLGRVLLTALIFVAC